MKGDVNRLTAKEVLLRYQDESLPEFYELDLHDVNQKGNFGDYPIHVACIRGNVEEVIALIEGGADIHVKGEMEQTPIFSAIIGESLNIVRLMLDMGANPLTIDEMGSTPLSYARNTLDMSKPDSSKIIALLEKAVANAIQK